MADTTRYVDLSLSTGANDGTTAADAWRTFADLEAAISAEVSALSAGDTYQVWCKRSASAASATTAWAYNENPPLGVTVIIEGYSSSTGDGLDTPGNWFQYGGQVNLTGDVQLRHFDVDTGTTTVDAALKIQYGHIYQCRGTTNSNAAGIYGREAVIEESIGVKEARSTTSQRLAIRLSRGAVINCVAEGGLCLESAFRTVSAWGNIVTPGPQTTAGDPLVLLDGSQDTSGLFFNGNTLYDATGDAVQIDEGQDTTRKLGPIVISRNVVWGAGGYAFRNAGSTYTDALVHCTGNFYGNCTSGEASGIATSMLSNTSLSADPFTDASSKDFSLNSTAGGGATVRTGARGDLHSWGTDVQHLAGAWQRGEGGTSAQPSIH